MLGFMRWFCLLLLAVPPVLAGGEIYRWVDEDGTVIYSDQPHPAAEKLDLPELLTIPAQRLPPPETEPPPGPPPYEDIAIVEPADDETIRDNAGNITVRASLTPRLRSELGHRLVLYMDGILYGEPAVSPEFNLTNVDRGSHSVAVAVVDEDGSELLRSTSVTFHLMRVSILLPASPGGN